MHAGFIYILHNLSSMKYMQNQNYFYTSDLLVFSADSWTGRAGFTCGTLELGVCALANATLTSSSAVTDLLVGGQTCAVVQRTVTGSTAPHGVADTLPAHTSSIP